MQIPPSLALEPHAAAAFLAELRRLHVPGSLPRRARLRGAAIPNALMTGELVAWLLFGGMAASRHTVQAGERPHFPTKTDLVWVDVVVTDRQGRPVPELGVEAFKVLDEGKAQRIEAFEAFTVGAPPSPLASGSAERSDQVVGRAFGIVYDDLRLRAGSSEARRSVDAIEGFASGLSAVSDKVLFLAPGWNLSAATTGASASTDLAPLLAELRVRFHPPLFPENVRVDIVYDAIDFVLNKLAAVRGRKCLLLFSKGLPYNSVGLRGLDRGLGRALGLGTPAMEQRRIVASSRRAGAPVFAFDSKGLSSAVRMDERLALADSSLASDAIVAETGGRVFRNANDLARAVRRFEEGSRSFYLLGFRPLEQGGGKEYRRIEVKVNRTGVEVWARPGYLAREDKSDRR